MSSINHKDMISVGSRICPWSPALTPGTNFWRKVKNTFFHPFWLWKMVINDADSDAILEGRNSSSIGVFAFISKVLIRTVWFWPRLVDAGVWVNEKSDPTPFRDMTEDSHFLVQEVARRATNEHAPLLDIGCNCGRHLAALADLNFDNLYGVDVNKEAIEKMSEWFPQLTGKCNAQVDLMQRYLSRSADNAFEIVFTRGATVELIHPSFPLVRELCRVSKSHVILMIRENEHAYTRFWAYEFYRNGFMLTDLVRPVHQMMPDKTKDVGKHISLLVFRRCP